MRNHQFKTIRLINSFHEKDFIEFNKFLKSPFFNENLSLVKLFGIIKECTGNKTDKELSLKKIHSLAFPDEEYDENITRKRLTALNKLIENYFSIINTENYCNIKRLYAIKELNKRNLSDYVKSSAVEFRKKMAEDEVSDLISQFHFIMLLYEEYRMFRSMHENANALKTTEEINRTTELFYINLKLINFSFSFIRKYRECNGNIDNSEFISFIQLNDSFISKSNSLIMLKTICELLCCEKQEKLNELLDIIIKNGNSVFYGLIDFIINLVLEYIVFKYNSGWKTERDIFNKLLFVSEKSGFLDRTKIVQPLNFLAVIIIYTDGGKNDYASQYIAKYLNKLDENQKNIIFGISKGMIYFSNNQFTEAVKLIEDLKPTEYILYCFVKILLSQCYYELNDYKKTLKTLESIKRYSYRKKDLHEVTKYAINRYVYYLSKLVNTRKNLFTFKINYIDKLNKENNVIRKEWLLLKTEDVRKLRINLVKD